MTSRTRSLYSKMSAADKIRQMYTKNLKPKPLPQAPLTENELKEHRTLFTNFDRNRDKHLDKNEYRDLVTFETTVRLDNKSINDVFLSHDANSDGLLSEEEFLEARGKMKSWLPSQFELYNMFQACDSNSDNRLSFNEFQSLWGQLGEDPRSRHLRGIFDRYDRSKSGTITREDLVRLVSQNLKPPKVRKSKWEKHVTFEDYRG